MSNTSLLFLFHKDKVLMYSGVAVIPAVHF